MAEPKWVDEARSKMKKGEAEQKINPDPELEVFQSENWLKKTDHSLPDLIE